MNVLKWIWRPVVSCLICGIKMDTKIKMTAVMTIAILYRGGAMGAVVVDAALLLPLMLPPLLLERGGVNQISRPVCFSITGSPSATSLLLAIHSLLASEFSHLARFSNVLKRKITTYSGFDRSEGLITSTPM